MSKDIYISSRFLTQPMTGVQRFGVELAKAIRDIKSAYYYNIIFVAPKNILNRKDAQDLKVKTIGS